MKTPWVHVGAASSKHIKSVYRAARAFLTSHLLLIGFKKMFRKWLKILHQQILLEIWISLPLVTGYCILMLANKINEAWNWIDTKLKNLTYDLNLLLAPTRAMEFTLAFASRYLVNSCNHFFFFHGHFMTQLVMINQKQHQGASRWCLNSIIVTRQWFPDHFLLWLACYPQTDSKTFFFLRPTLAQKKLVVAKS